MGINLLKLWCVINCMKCPDLHRTLTLPTPYPSWWWGTRKYTKCSDVHRNSCLQSFHFDVTMRGAIYQMFARNCMETFQTSVARNNMKWPDLHRKLMFCQSLHLMGCGGSQYFMKSQGLLQKASLRVLQSPNISKSFAECQGAQEANKHISDSHLLPEACSLVKLKTRPKQFLYIEQKLNNYMLYYVVHLAS